MPWKEEQLVENDSTFEENQKWGEPLHLLPYGANILSQLIK